MRASTLIAVTAGVLFGFASVATAQQQKGPPQTMQGMDQSNMQGMQGMQGMDHSKMPMNMPGLDHSKMPGMQGNGQTGQGARAHGPAKPGRPGTTPQ